MKGVKTVSYNVSWTSPKVQWRRVGGKKRPPPPPPPVSIPGLGAEGRGISGQSPLRQGF